VVFIQAPPSARLVACTNLGIAASKGRVVHVLAAGWQATPDWTDRPLARFAAEDIAAVVPAMVNGSDDRGVPAGVRIGRGGRRVGLSAPRPGDEPLAAGAGPILEAGFWRTDVLHMAGPGFSTACGDALADADMAAALGCLPLPVVYEEACRVIRGTSRSMPRSFRAGLYAERLFWRSLGRGSRTAALAAHLVEGVRDAVARLPLGTLPMLAGRLVALAEFGSTVHRLRQLRGLRDAPIGEESGHTLRIDEPHDGVVRPRGRRTAQRPLKRSA
jgi:hypothetical protein